MCDCERKVKGFASSSFMMSNGPNTPATRSLAGIMISLSLLRSFIIFLNRIMLFGLLFLVKDPGRS